MRDFLDRLGLGLSRLLRYSYGAFLVVALVSLLRHDIAKQVREAMGWELVVVTALVLGAGVYAVHRGVVVPVHHAVLCLGWYIADLLAQRGKERSANPTRYLGSLGVSLLWRIPAYTVLRRGPLFQEHKDDWDVAHAEAGLVLMTFEVLLLGGLYACTQADPAVSPGALLWSSAVLFVFSFGVFGQHALECRYFRAREQEIREELQTSGLLPRQRAV